MSNREETLASLPSELQPASKPAEALAAVEVIHPSAERAAERIGGWYDRLEPRVGVYLTDPNVVLTLADARGQTEFFVPYPQPGDTEAFEELNRVSMPQGIRFLASEDIKRSTGEPDLAVNLESLAGYELMSAQTRLPGIPRFEASTGWEGLEAWKHEAMTAMKQAVQHGHYPQGVSEAESMHILVGVIKGYPDQAVMAGRGAGAELVTTQIPHADYYKCASPNYTYDAKDQAYIEAHVDNWGHLLEQYYHSSTHQKLEADSRFQQARKQANTE